MRGAEKASASDCAPLAWRDGAHKRKPAMVKPGCDESQASGSLVGASACGFGLVAAVFGIAELIRRFLQANVATHQRHSEILIRNPSCRPARRFWSWGWSMRTAKQTHYFRGGIFLYGCCHRSSRSYEGLGSGTDGILYRGLVPVYALPKRESGRRPVPGDSRVRHQQFGNRFRIMNEL